ncbi:hypothetical protein KP509_19G000600 [Ceratopteris richardii]|uniref:Uncharacterized protein n=1 Tax=Ceratopteris richardii TaxID=49495 RepID=A0A8T2SKU9_CERRI|nr:hypothetical protein KP509_19G000600 [Ceratopteris richardii]
MEDLDLVGLSMQSMESQGVKTMIRGKSSNEGDFRKSLKYEFTNRYGVQIFDDEHITSNVNNENPRRVMQEQVDRHNTQALKSQRVDNIRNDFVHPNVSPIRVKRNQI